jgi:hypothetical protein
MTLFRNVLANENHGEKVWGLHSIGKRRTTIEPVRKPSRVSVQQFARSDLNNPSTAFHVDSFDRVCLIWLH